MIGDFITRIVAPALNSPSFANDLDEAFRNIDDNFKKIVSAPYLEGQEGNSVEAYDMHIVENGELTDFGMGMVRSIFDDQTINSIQDIDGIAPPIQGFHAYDSLQDSNTVKVFVSVDPDIDPDEFDPSTTDRWICSAEYYYFVDRRIEGLGNSQNPSDNINFVDYSCLIFAEWNGNEWVFTKGNMVPTLYFDSQSGKFCWKVNGIETGIFAQGLPGPAGTPPVSAVVRGNGVRSENLNEQIINVICNEYLSVSYEPISSSWENISESDISNGDLVVCLFTYTDENHVSYPDMVISNIMLNDDMTFRIVAPDKIRMSSLWTSYILFHAFKDIDYMSDTGNKTKAIFVPTKSIEVGGSEKKYAHAMFQDDSNVVYEPDSHDVYQSSDTSDNRDLVFRKVVVEKMVGSGSVGPQSIMSKDEPYDVVSDVKFEGYNAKARVSGAENVYLGVPVGSIVTWENMTQIPENWVVTGNVSDASLHNPVFRIEFSQDYSGDHDVVLQNSGATITDGYGILKDLRNQYQHTYPRNKDLKNIFSSISGFAIESGVAKIPVTYSTLSDFFANGDPQTDLNWTSFDITVDRTNNYIDFYLTKYI